MLEYAPLCGVGWFPVASASDFVYIVKNVSQTVVFLEALVETEELECG